MPSLDGEPESRRAGSAALDPAPPVEIAETADQVLVALSSRAPRLGSTRLVAIDGPAGSGKTTLAIQLDRQLRGGDADSDVLHLDDMYEGWTGLEKGLEHRILDQVLAPLAAGTAACWQRYDWNAGRFADWVDLPAPEVLILEGCGSGAQAYAAYHSLLIWIEAPLEQRIASGI
ncbi:MAG: uridine kinase family protein, partial [Nocardioidaceae bacterium]